jgi:manganese/zinc/iron transport system ATP- binding protein
MEFCLETKNLSLSYHDSLVLNDINLKVPYHKLAAIVGPNGAGKSSLLKSILGLVPHQQGNVLFFNQVFDNQRKRIAYIPQRSAVDWDFPATVLDVVLMGLYVYKGLFGRINKEDKQNALEALEKVNLIEFQHRQISQLSGGQQQRVFIARALVQNPDLFLMDEPFAGVDAQSEATILSVLKELVANKKTILVVHHNLNTVKEYFDHLILLNKKIITQGDIQSTFTNENLRNTYGNLFPNFNEL